MSSVGSESTNIARLADFVVSDVELDLMDVRQYWDLTVVVSSLCTMVKSAHVVAHRQYSQYRYVPHGRGHGHDGMDFCTCG